ncbi:MAG: hypothetical protein QME45_04810 [Clostridiales bacterium]|nr:hypothetical protein [Clostridiales bacterium]
MADRCVPYTLPYKNLCSGPSQNGISVMQPACQSLMDGSIVNNPCFNIITGISVWTYSLFSDCSSGGYANPVESILIPVCHDISKENIIVEEKIENYGKFNIIPFMLLPDDITFGQAPSGFQYLKIENNGRYERGAHVEYRISIAGDYPALSQPITVKAGHDILKFACQNGYKVPGCPIPDKLTAEKKSSLIIKNNSAVLEYNVSIKNEGGSNLEDIKFQDILSYDGANVALAPLLLPVDLKFEITTVSKNTVMIFGKINSIIAGQSINFKYDVPIDSFMQPGAYIFTNITTVSCGTISSSDTCTNTVNVVRLKGESSIKVTENNKIIHHITVANTGTSPDTSVKILDRIFIPGDVLIQFTDFCGCTATFENGNRVSLNMNITNSVVNISHEDLPIPSGGGVRLPIEFVVVSTSAFKSPAKITGTLMQLLPAHESQIFLPPLNIPSSSSVEIVGGCNLQ